MLNAKIAALAGALLFAQSSFAGPLACPDVDLIKSEGVKAVGALKHFVGFQSHKYDTDNWWSFAVGPVYSETEEDAQTALEELLTNLVGTPNPMQSDIGSWVCHYETNMPKTYAIAIWNPMGQDEAIRFIPAA